MIDDPGFTTTEMSDLMGAAGRVRAMCMVEGALAAAHAMAGNITAAAAAAVGDVCSRWNGSPAELLSRGWVSGTPVMPLLDDLRASLDPEHHHSLHLGATSQDIIDTALMWQCSQANAVIAHQLGTLSGILDSWRDTCGEAMVIGRTLLQPALPMRWVDRLAAWQRPIIGAAERIAGCPLPVQLGGPVGDGRTIERHATVVAAFAHLLKLDPPAEGHGSWHSDRAPVRDVIARVHDAAAAAATVARNVALLAQPEIGEIRLEQGGGSSSMPHKRNPSEAARAVAAAQVSAAALAGLVASPPNDLERGLGPWHAEQTFVPMAWCAASAALDATIALLRSCSPVLLP